jgi:hypothetical protein
MRPTLSLQTYFTPDLTLQIALDGVGIEGPVVLQAVSGEGPDAEFNRRMQYIFPAQVAFEAHGGRVVIAGEAVDTLSKGEYFELVIADVRHRLPRSGVTHPFRCAQAISALRALDACVELLPSPGLGPEACDESGVEAWRQERQKKQERQRSCGLETDEATVALLGRVRALLPRGTIHSQRKANEGRGIGSPPWRRAPPCPRPY